jgi:uncharacterized membrane protein YphA (DoxX/SURF4 family)
MTRLAGYSSVFLRLALGTAFLSAVADRFGLWGAFGQPNVAWGDFAHFTAYTAKLNWFAPPTVIPAMAWLSTLAELLLGLALILGLFTRLAAILSGSLLLLFAIAMTVTLGIESPLNLSVFTASAGSFLLASCARVPLSIDAKRRNAT